MSAIPQLMLFLGAIAAPGGRGERSEAGAAAGGSTPLPPCVQALGELLQREAFGPLLTEASACRQTTGHPRAAYFQGIAYLAMGEPSSAIGALERYLAESSASEAPRLLEIAAHRLEKAKSLAGQVVLTIETELDAGELMISIRRVGEASPRLAKPLAELIEPTGSARLWLNPGSYLLTASAAGVLSSQRQIEVHPGGRLEVGMLVRKPVAQPDVQSPAVSPRASFPSTPWFASTGAASGALVVAGLVSLPAGRVGAGKQMRPRDECNSDIASLDQCRRRLAYFTGLSGAGAGLLGTGLGVLGGGLVALLPRASARRTAWVAEAGVSGAIVATGAALLAIGLRDFNALNLDSGASFLLWGDAFETRTSRYARTYVGGALALGFGVGLGLSAGTGLLVEHLSPGRTTRARLTPLGLAVQF